MERTTVQQACSNKYFSVHRYRGYSSTIYKRLTLQILKKLSIFSLMLLVFFLYMASLDMSHEVTLVGTSVGTVWTDEWLLPSMLAEMYGELGLTDGLISANLTAILPSTAILRQMGYGPPNGKRSHGWWKNHVG